jgi:hypothetical protein
MAVFLKNILRLVLGVFLLVFGILFLTFELGKNKVAKLDKNVTTIFIGDSHFVYGINDIIYPRSSNLSAESESLYYSFFKLNNILVNNPDIDTIILSFGYHSISKQYDEFIFGNNSIQVSKRYFYLLPLDEMFFLAQHNLKNLIFFVKEILFNEWYRIVDFNASKVFKGDVNVYRNTEAKVSMMNMRLNDQFNMKEYFKFSSLNIQSLLNINNVCKKYNVKLITLNTPVHGYYESNIPSIFKNKYREIIKYHGILNIDMTKLKLENSCYLPDGDHLSIQGSTKTTLELKRILNIN